MKNSTKHLIVAPPPISLKLVIPKRSATPAEVAAPEIVDGAVAPPLPAPLRLVAAAVAIETSSTQSASPPPIEAKVPASLPPTRVAVPGPPTAIDIKIEAGKIPLHIAVMESILAAGTPDRQKRLSQNVLLVGGTARIHNVGFAIESR